LDGSDIKKFITTWIEESKPEFDVCSQFLFENPELGMQEFKSSKLLADLIEKYGFTVTRGIGGMPTAFSASYGSNKPIIGFNAEFDCLPGLSQKVTARKDPVIDGAPGHGCGHCLLGPGGIQGAVALRYAMEKFGLRGTIKVFGTPYEEMSVGKAFMARAGAFDEVDAFLDWHPFFNRTFVHRHNNAYFNKKYHFRGISAHGNSPWNGRSTLDAAVMMANALEMLREHIRPGTEDAASTINYTFSDVGAEYPNVIPDHSSVWIMARFPTLEILTDAMERVDNCARAAALATGTRLEIEFIAATHNGLANKTLGQIVYDNVEAIGPMPVSDEEQDFARELQKNAGNAPVGIVQEHLPPCEYDAAVTDVSEYSWIAPLATVWLGVMPGPVLHNWVITAAAGSSIGKKAINYAAKILASSALDLLLKPEILQKAHAEHKEVLNGRVYECLIPADVLPPLSLNKNTMERYFKS
jgi:aminobenzoyl-glutamate utilization protein B